MSTPVAQRAPIFEVRGLAKHYLVPAHPLSWTKRRVRALDGVDFDLHAGETLAIVGESGSGKTTLARALLRLVEPSAGRVLYRPRDGSAAVDWLKLPSRDLRRLRPEVQIVFQDPEASLNPRVSAIDAVREVLRVTRGLDEASATHASVERLASVGLDAHLHTRRPHELSSGQRQRVSLARALAADPRVLVLDEALASLDVSIQAQILNLLAELRASHGLAYLFIAHDLELVRWLSDRVAVLHEGRIVESGDTEAIFASPRHAATRALLANFRS